MGGEGGWEGRGGREEGREGGREEGREGRGGRAVKSTPIADKHDCISSILCSLETLFFPPSHHAVSSYCAIKLHVPSHQA